MADTLVAYEVFRGLKVVQNVNDGELDLDPVPLGYKWRVEQVAVGVFASALDYYEGSGPPAVYLFDRTPVGPTSLPIQATYLQRYNMPQPWPQTTGVVVLWADWFEESPPLTILGGNQLAIVLGPVAQPGQTYYARVQYELWQGTSGEPQPFAGGEPAPTIPAAI